MEKNKKEVLKRVFNMGLVQIIFWAITVILISSSSACSEDKVLWLILCVLGMNYSFDRWLKYSVVEK